MRLVELDKKACNRENSGGKLTPFGQGGGSVLFEFVATVEMALEVEMVVDRGMNGDEFLQCFQVSELRHYSFSSSEPLV